jgi:hypothetical protein
MSATQRRLTVMFADVSGSTALFEKLGDREAMHAVERCLKRMNRSIDGYKGKTIQIVGDELLASFENAEEACQAAIDMQQRIADLPPVSGLKLTIRIGLHSGVVSASEGKLGGPAVATAARIAGSPGAIRSCAVPSWSPNCRNPASSPSMPCPNWAPWLKTASNIPCSRSTGQAIRAARTRCPLSGRKATCRPNACAFVIGQGLPGR